MAEMFKIGDRNNDDLLTRWFVFLMKVKIVFSLIFVFVLLFVKYFLNFSFREEFVNGMLEHPVTSRILMIKKIDAILDTM